jgi:hypothetical protein
MVDDAGTTDTGLGTPPIIDMGPYEYQGTSLTFVGPIPGEPGTTNGLQALGGTPGEYVYAGYGFTSGSSNVPGCPGVSVAIQNAKLIGRARANGSGIAVIRFYVPGQASGVRVYFQAVDLTDCRTSQRVEHTF